MSFLASHRGSRKSNWRDSSEGGRKTAIASLFFSGPALLPTLTASPRENLSLHGEMFQKLVCSVQVPIPAPAREPRLTMLTLF